MPNVKVDSTYLSNLEAASRKLRALEQAGVDNWEGYDDAIEPYLKYQMRIDKIDDFIEDVLTVIAENIDEPAGRDAGYAVEEPGHDYFRSQLEKLLAELEE